jgi:hypothetical protein
MVLWRDGMKPLKPDTATWLIMAILNEAVRCEQLRVGPQPMQVFGEQVFRLANGQCHMSALAIHPVRAASLLERLAKRVQQMRVELESCVALKGVAR